MIQVTFPRGVYSGAVLGVAEEVPEPSRVYEALVAAAAGGPWAEVRGRALVAGEDHREALRWLEAHDPQEVIVPPLRATVRTARRYRWRTSPVTADDTSFEPMIAVAGAVTYVWPEAPASVVQALRQIALEVTHVGRADSIALIRVSTGRPPLAPGHTSYRVASRRGPGRVMRVARPGRLEALERAHAEVVKPGSYHRGSLGKQAADRTAQLNETALVSRRFELCVPDAPWPYRELWVCAVRPTEALAALAAPANRVAAAVGIHRALVRAIGSDVPSLVTGRDGDGPRRGAGHVAIHIVPALEGAGAFHAVFAIPADANAGDRAQLAAALERPLRVALRRPRQPPTWFTIEPPTAQSALGYWGARSRLCQTVVPFVVEVNGGPRSGGWTLDDAAVCSVGFALRGVLEQRGLRWGTGWEFRTGLVRALRDEYGVDARARRIASSPSRFVHRAPEGQLVIAAHAVVDLGRLAPASGDGFLAIGRARHLGGGLLAPVGT